MEVAVAGGALSRLSLLVWDLVAVALMDLREQLGYFLRSGASFCSYGFSLKVFLAGLILSRLEVRGEEDSEVAGGASSEGGGVSQGSRCGDFSGFEGATQGFP